MDFHIYTYLSREIILLIDFVEIDLLKVLNRPEQ